MERGEIRNKDFAKQLNNFKGLRWGNITPTDIDGFIEYHGKGFIIFELKYKGTELPYGQRLALERECDDHKKPTLLIIASHECLVPDDVNAADATVVEYRYDKRWFRDSGRSLKQVIDSFINFLDG